MRKVVLSNKSEYLLTDNEFKEASFSWLKKELYFCERLKAIINGAFIIEVKVPDEEVDRDIFIYPFDKILHRFFISSNGKIWEFLNYEGPDNLLEITFKDEESKKKFIEQSIPQDTYYEKQFKLLKEGKNDTREQKQIQCR
jgi:hypothetical protein